MTGETVSVIWYRMDELPSGQIDPSRMGEKRSPTYKECHPRITKADWEATRIGLEEDRRAGLIPPGPWNAAPPPALPPHPGDRLCPRLIQGIYSTAQPHRMIPKQTTLGNVGIPTTLRPPKLAATLRPSSFATCGYRNGATGRPTEGTVISVGFIFGGKTKMVSTWRQKTHGEEELPMDRAPFGITTRGRAKHDRQRRLPVAAHNRGPPRQSMKVRKPTSP
jgi:hypothetical protein